MVYRNTKTGATVNVDSVVHGDWELVEELAPVSVTEEKETVKPKRIPKKRTK